MKKIEDAAHCRHTETTVINTAHKDNAISRGLGRIYLKYNPIAARRRRCLECGETFTTMEITEDTLHSFFKNEIAFLKEEIKKIDAIRDIINSLQIKDEYDV